MELRLATENDAQEYMNLRNADDTYHWFYSQQKFTVKQVEDWLKTRDIAVDRVYIAYEGKQVVGTCSIYDIDLDKGQAEVGRIIVGGKYRGHGLGTQILCEMTKVAKHLSLQRIYAHIKEDNKSSQRAFEKAGFVLTANNTYAVRLLRGKEV